MNRTAVLRRNNRVAVAARAGMIDGMVIVRSAVDEDGPFLESMLLVAADWRSEVPARSVAHIMAVPSLAHYIADWPRTGDGGVVADVNGPVGAAWWRYFDAEDPGFGFVDPATPEVSIGVRYGWRGQGIGETLLRALMESARAEGVDALNLSVERDNGAVRLYERAGFEAVARSGGAVTMLVQLSS